MQRIMKIALWHRILFFFLTGPHNNRNLPAKLWKQNCLPIYKEQKPEGFQQLIFCSRGTSKRKDGGQDGLFLTPGMRDGSKSWIWSPVELRKSLLMSCNQFQKDTVALRVFKPWRFKLNHTCHMHTVSLMSLCKYLIFSICISQPNLPHQPLLPDFSNTIIRSYRATSVSGVHHALLCFPLSHTHLPLTPSFPFYPLNN